MSRAMKRTMVSGAFLAAALGAALPAFAADPIKIKAGAAPFVVEGFERLAADGKILIGAHPKSTYVNLTASGWGGDKGLTISSSKEYVTEGSLSAKIAIDFVIKSRKQTNGACFGLGWDNASMIPASFGPNLTKVAYVLIDYTWKPDPACDIANPKVLNLGIHLSARNAAMSDASKGELSNFGNTDPSGKGTLIVKLPNTVKEGTVLVPQFAIKVYHSADDNDLDALAKDVGKRFKGTLWLDNIRFADADGNVLQK